MSRRLRARLAGPHCCSALSVGFIAALISVALLTSTAMALPGDMNCDGAINSADVPDFVQALVNPGEFGGCDVSRADINADGVIDGRDAQPFVEALLVPACPVGLTLCGGVCTNLMFDPSNCGGCGIICTVTCSGGICRDGN